MHIFDVLGLPEQVAYYQEHFDKFVKNECSKSVSYTHLDVYKRQASKLEPL